MDAGAALRLLLDAHRLKAAPRTGWALRGVADAESVADHSFGVALVCLILAELVDQSIDRAKLLTIALLHDLPESVIGDLPAPAAIHFPPDAKRQAGALALGELLRALPWAEEWHAWWREYEDGTSAEGRLVRDADRLDMLIQAHIYEQTTGNRWLGEFWASSEKIPFEFAVAQTLCEELMALRQASVAGEGASC
jgi:putative hydrolase of HD superfamily